MPAAGDPIPCPICRRPVPPAGDRFPFCSLRCRDLDLAGWASGSYAVAADHDPDDDR